MAIHRRGKSTQIDYFCAISQRVGSRRPGAKKYRPTSLNELLEKYEESYKHQSSFANSKCHYINNFREYFGKNSHVDQITYSHLLTYRSHLRQKPTKTYGFRAAATINREIACLHHIFEKAVEWKMIVRSPFSGGKTLLAKENNKRVRYLTDAEISKLLSHCSRHLRPIVVCALHTGMRKGEILNLEWSQVRNGFICLKSTNYSLARQIPVDDTLQSLLEGMRKKQASGVRNVFTFTKGEHRMKEDKPVRERKGPAPKPVTVKNISTAFTSALERAGISDFKFNDLRHTFASHMLMKGGNLKELEKLFGHKSISMVLRYAHLAGKQ